VNIKVTEPILEIIGEVTMPFVTTLSLQKRGTILMDLFVKFVTLNGFTDRFVWAL